jgi:hypothetical protein
MKFKKKEGWKNLEKVVDEDEEKDKKLCHDYRGKLKWISDRADYFAKKTGLAKDYIINFWESERNYWYMNYYQDCNQPIDNDREEKRIIYSVTFFSVEESEILRHETKDDAIGDFVDALWNPKETVKENLKRIPKEITLFYYHPRSVDPSNISVLDHVLEYLDEEYGDPDGGYTDPTPAMKDAERRFSEAIAKEYEPWACEVVFEEKIDLHEWTRRK